jgi:murein DD-endopeptidase MepM/ murein hydrolase activator NlpD
MKIQPIGFQFPQQQQVDVAPVVVDTPASVTALDITNQGYAAAERANQQYVQTTQQATQSTQQTAQILQQNSQSIAQSQNAVLQQKQQSSNNFAVSLQSIQRGVGDMMNYNVELAKIDDTRRREAADKSARLLAAQEKIDHDDRKAKVVGKLEQLSGAWIKNGMIREYGATAYLDMVAKEVAAAKLDGDSTTTLTQKYAQPAQDYSKEVYTEEQKAAETVVLKQREVDKRQLLAPLNVIIAKIKTSEGRDAGEVAKQWAELQAGMETIMADKRFSQVTRLESVAMALEAGAAGMSTSNENYQKMNNAASAYRNVTAFAAQQRIKANNSEIGPQEYEDTVRQKALELGVSGYQPADLNAELKFVEERLRVDGSITTMRKNAVLSETEGIEADNAIVGGLAIDAVLDPSGAGSTIRAAAKKGADKNAIEAVRVADDFIKFRATDKQQYDVARAAKQTEISRVGANFNSWFVSNTKTPGASSQNPAVAKQLEMLRTLSGITPEQVQGGQLTAEQVNLMQSSAEAIQQSLIAEQVVDDKNFANKLQEFSRYGLFLNEADMKTSRKSFTQKIDAYMQRKADIEAQSAVIKPVQGMTGTFKQGTIKQLAKRSYAGSSMVVPFTAAVANAMPDGTSAAGQLYGDSRGATRRHTGLDFGVPSGTEVLSTIDGVVQYVEPITTVGYGLNVGVKGADGLIHYFAHLSAANVVVGQQISAGEVIALSGNSGGTAGKPMDEHLHMGTYREGGEIFNPVHILSKAAVNNGSAKAPRTAGYSQANIPRGATPIGKNQYLLNGALFNIPSGPPARTTTGEAMTTVYIPPGTKAYSKTKFELDGTQMNIPTSNERNRSGMVAVQVPANGSPLMQLGSPLKARAVTPAAAKPVSNSFASNRASDYVANIPPDHHHGYAILANDKPFAAAINRVANKYGMPGQWLADVIAYESAGTFSPSIDNEHGFVGLIQFGEALASDMGVTQSQLRRGTRLQQMEYVDRALAVRLKQSGVKAYKGPEWLVAGINQGNRGIYQVETRGAAAILDPANTDGYTTLEKYMANLGKYSGRKYNYMGNRKVRTTAAVHEKHTDNCAFCDNLIANNLSSGFIRHQASLA